MSTPRRLGYGDDVLAVQTTTARGAFAALTCAPQETSLPRGNALLLPGFTGSKEDFADLLPLLAQAGWGAASFDQRGQFETTASATDDFSLAGFAADAAAVAAELFGVDELVHLVGHSFGGLVASTAVVGQPHRWASLTLLCSGPGGLSGAAADEAREAAVAIRRDGLEAVYQKKRQRDLRRGLPEPSAEIEEFLHRRFLSNSPESLAAMADLLATAPDLTPSLAGQQVTTAVLRGEHDDAWPHEVQDALAEALGTEVVVIPDAAHSPAVEQPEATRDALARSWLG